MKLSEDRQSTSIYLEQIENHINLGQGYNKIRILLFKELHMMDGNHPSVDDKLAESIVIKLANTLTSSLNFHQSDKTFRCLEIITDLLTYAEDIITPAMHTDLFMTSLTEIAKPRLVTFNSSLDSSCRNIALQIIAFWFQKYSRDESTSYDLFIQAYKYLKGDKKLVFPDSIRIKPVNTYKLQPKTQKSTNQNNSPENTTKIILQDIQQYTKTTQRSLAESIKSIATTEEVRLIKHKSKVLFEFTQKGSDLTVQQKNKVKDLYKRLRTVLKEVDKYNQSKLQTKASISHQQEYVEQKITPKKKEKKSQSPVQEKKQSQKKEEVKNEVDLLSGLQTAGEVKKISQEKKEVQSKPKVQINLLDLDFGGGAIPTTPPKTSQIPNQTPFEDLLGGNPVKQSPKKDAPQIEEEEEFIEGVLIDNVEPQTVLVSQEKSIKQLQEVFSTPSKKHVSAEEDSDKLVKNESNYSKGDSPGFDNEQKKDKYAHLQHINLSPTSSNEEDEIQDKKEGLGLNFNLFGIFGNKDKDVKGEGSLFDEHCTYDDVPAALQNIPKEQSSTKPSVAPDLLFGQPEQELQVSIPSKPVKAVDYTKFAVQTSLNEDDKEEDEEHSLDKNKPFQELEEIEVQSPRKQSAKGDLLQQQNHEDQ